MDEGDLLVLLGPNGAGKSSLMSALTGWIRPDEGQVLLSGSPIGSLKATERAASLAWLPQHTDTSESLRVDEAMRTARFRFSDTAAQEEQAITEALRWAGMLEFRQRDLRTLSGGEAQRIHLARLAVQQAPLWMLDEPANHLDPRTQREVYRLLLDRWRAGTTMVLITHDPALLLASLAPPDLPRVHLAGMKEGRMAWILPADAPDLASHLGDLYQLQAHILQTPRGPRLQLEWPS